MKRPLEAHIARLQILALTPYEAAITIKNVFKKTGKINITSIKKKSSKNTKFSAQ